MSLDIRTKTIILLLVTCTVGIVTNLAVEISAVCFLAMMQLLSGKSVFQYRLLIIYLALVLTQVFLFPILPETLVMVLSLFVVSLRKLFPTAMGFVWIYKTTKVNQLIATLTKMRIPKGAIVSIAVTLRFFPTIFEEWGHIRDAMRIRAIKQKGLHPFRNIIRTMECYCVPLLISATKTADELSAAAITRGIDNPATATCRKYKSMSAVDYGALALTLILTIGAVVA